MSYMTTAAAAKKVKISTLEFDGTMSTGNYCDFTIVDEFPSAFITSLTATNTEINLPTGHYFVQAFLDYTRSSVSEEIKFQWELDSTLEGHWGASDFYHANTVDNAEAVFSLTSAGVLKLKIVDRLGTGTFTLNSSHCYACIWRTDL